MRTVFRARCVAAAGALFLAAVASAGEARAACAPSSGWTEFPSGYECVGGVHYWTEAFYHGASTFPGGWGSAVPGNCPADGACQLWLTDVPSQSGVWNRHAWGSVPVQKYDIVVYPPGQVGAYGHVAAIDHQAGGVLWVMDDNWGGGDTKKKSCLWGGDPAGYVHSMTATPYGFYRRKVDEPCACKAGDTESQTCSTCGSQTRQCESCAWSDWSACTVPPFEASMVDVSYPETLGVGAQAQIWAEFKNEGMTAWPARGLWMGALGGPDGGTSAFYAPDEGWPAYNVTTTLPDAVAPGDVGRFAFQVTGPDLPGMTLTETFQLESPDGYLLSCPGGAVKTSITIIPGANGTGGASGAGGALGSGGLSGTGGDDAPGLDANKPGGCSQAPAPSSWPAWMWTLEALALLGLARSRAHARVGVRRSLR